MYHGQERQEQRSRDYQRTELMAIGEQLRAVEDRLNNASSRLAQLERMLTEQHGTVQASANAITEG